MAVDRSPEPVGEGGHSSPLAPLRWRPGIEVALPVGPCPEGSDVHPPALVLIDRGDPLLRPSMEGFPSLLSREELHRWRSFCRRPDAERFLLGRAVLRLLLGRLTGQPPATLRLACTPSGKPYLPGTGGRERQPPPCFNLSHSGDLILLGFHSCRRLGVDLELVRPVPHWREIARRFLPAGELEAIGRLPEADRQRAFLEAWCRLEAGLKALGVGGGQPRPETAAPGRCFCRPPTAAPSR